jgi:hypothetical protein
MIVLCVLLAAASVSAADWKTHVIQPPDGVKGQINTAVAADFDKDGNMDVMASYGGLVTFYRGPDWKRSIVHRFPGHDNPRARGCIHSTLLDVDGDGDADYVGSNGVVFWLECPEDPSQGPWTYRLIDDEIKGVHCVMTGDVDQDGRLDLIANSFQTAKVTSVPESITWMTVPKDVKAGGKWQRQVFADKDAPGGNHYMGFGDVNGDGRPDIACGAKGGEKFPGGEWFAWWEQPPGGKLPWKKHMLAANEPGASNILPADVNGDGHIDYVASRGHGQGVLWFKSSGATNGTVSFKLIDIDKTIVTPHSLDVGDIDLDGDIDIATCGSKPTGEAAWYENDGKGNFTRHNLLTDQSSYDTRLVDMDKDGDPDILIGGKTNRTVIWLENPTR